MIHSLEERTARTAKADLYRLVFTTRGIKYVVFLMMLFFLFHPVMPAFASEVAANDVAASDTASSEESEAAAPNEPAPAEQRPTEEAVAAEVTEAETVAATSEAVSPELPEAVDTEIVTEEVVVSPEETTNEPASPTVVVDEDSTAVEETPVTPSEQEPSVPAPTYEEELGTPEDTSDEAATSSTTVPEPEFIEVSSDVTHSDTHYQFAKAQCVSMGGGAFHCFEASDETVAVSDDALYVDRDSDGDKEIYLRTGNDVHQITNNKLDDDAPYFDPVSNTIVWHRLENGQYAIYSYQDERETRVSDGSTSSMEPHRAGNYTVWQAWIDNHWQVMLHDGTTPRVISATGVQNIAPQVEGAYVIWNVTTGDTHRVAVYEIATGLTSIIDDGEGARVMNPRFVLVYDTKFENGDVITKGYDAETGDLIPLAAAAPVVPTELPSSDQTGETRALLQNKSSSREEFKDELEPTEDTALASSSPQGGTASSTTDTIVITPPGAASDVLPLTDFDLIVEPFTSSTSATSTQ